MTYGPAAGRVVTTVTGKPASTARMPSVMVMMSVVRLPDAWRNGVAVPLAWFIQLARFVVASLVAAWVRAWPSKLR